MVGEVAGAARVSGRLAAERLGDLADEGAGAVQSHAAARSGGRELRQPGLDLRRRLRADPGHRVEPPGRRCLAQLGQRADPERVAELSHPLGREAQQPCHPDELRQRLRLELLQLRQLAGLHQLAQPLLDPGPDPGELAHATRADELRDVRRRRADQLGGAPVRADGVVPRLVQVEQGGEGFEPFGEMRVLHD